MSYDEHDDLVSPDCVEGTCACEKICAHSNGAEFGATTINNGADLVVTGLCVDCGHLVFAASSATKRPSYVVGLSLTEGIARRLG